MRSTFLTAAALAATLLAAVPSSASAAPPGVAAAAAEPCNDGSLQATSHSGLIPTSHRLGQRLYIYTPFHNTSASPRPGERLYVQIDAYRLRRSFPPVIYWRVDHYAWHRMNFSWVPAGRFGPASDAFWETAEMPMGGFGPHKTHTVELMVSFPRHAATGIYSGYESIGSTYCYTHGPSEQGFSGFEVAYEPNRYGT